MFRKLCCLGVCLALCLAGCSEGEPSSQTPDDILDDYVASQPEAETLDFVSDGVTFDGTHVSSNSDIELTDGSVVSFVTFDDGGALFHVDNKGEGIVSVQGVQVFNGTETVVQDDLIFPEAPDDLLTDEAAYVAYEDACASLYNCLPGETLDYTCTFSGLNSVPKGSFTVSLQGYLDDGKNITEYFNLTWKCER